MIKPWITRYMKDLDRLKTIQAVIDRDISGPSKDCDSQNVLFALQCQNRTPYFNLPDTDPASHHFDRESKRCSWLSAHYETYAAARSILAT